MHYEPTEAELNGLTGDETASTEAQAAYFHEQAEAVRQAHHHDDEQQQAAWEAGEYEQMQAYVEGY